MSKIEIAIVGASGRMGQEILKLVANQKVWKVALGVSSAKGARRHEQIYGSFPVRDRLKGFDGDLVIDFSSPAGLARAVQDLSSDPKPLVSGTTGISKRHFSLLEAFSRRAPVLWAPNMSLGIATLLNAIQTLASLSDGFDFQVEEIHHRAKKDAPSGTAKLLQQKLASSIKKGKLPKPLSIRGGGVPGVHRVLAMGEHEWLSFEHVATDRRVFAAGALRAGRWLVKQKPGLYTLSDLLSAKG